MKVINPPSLLKPHGYNHGVLMPAGQLLFIAGQAGMIGDELESGFVDQFAAALRNVRAVVEAAGGQIEHVARLTIYVTDMSLYLQSREALAPAYREIFGHHYPVMSAIEVKGLIDPRLLVEIEATAVLP
jgi:enamine deaminase RidA (YjgF/YER057c/UK114 family)